ncbi:MAG TPA: hypothetical protein VHB20_13800 [Verrucomicrobiae bacterium]|jgi:hypothetical protein|nr:hypothetical protein [Verrucomicrobiae bacterium]
MKLKSLLFIGMATITLATASFAADRRASFEPQNEPPAAAPTETPKTALGGTNWLEALGVSDDVYGNLTSRLSGVQASIEKALRMTNDAVAAEALEQAIASYEDLGNGQLKDIGSKLGELADAYQLKQKNMEDFQRTASPANAVCYGQSAARFRKLREDLQTRAGDLESIRAQIKRNAAAFRERKAYFVSLIELKAGEELREAVDNLVVSLRGVEKEISTALSAPLSDAAAKRS